jgi:NAD(P)H-hydrate repair Nnr-like enzyme with NAD(P)H-hydrate dehydratase domain
VLTGLIAALVAQGLAPFEAARLGVHLHGRAGDLAVKKLGVHSLMATDLLDYLPAAFLEHRRRSR